MSMAFNAEGKLDIISLKSGEILNGKWKLKKKGQVVMIRFDNKEADHGNFKIESLSFDQLILEKKGNRIYFDRGQNSSGE